MVAAVLVLLATAVVVLVMIFAVLPAFMYMEYMQARMMGLWVVIGARRYDRVDREVEAIRTLLIGMRILNEMTILFSPFLGSAIVEYELGARDQMDAYETIILGKIGFLPRDLKPLMTGTVTRVKDGDTFVLDDLYNLRMDGINAPEMDEPEGPASKEYLESLILGRQVDIHVDMDDRMDHYNRVIGVVYLGKRNICDEMVDAGHAETFLYELAPLEPREIWPIGPRP